MTSIVPELTPTVENWCTRYLIPLTVITEVVPPVALLKHSPKLATTDLALSMVKVHVVDVPLQAPPQLVKLYPAKGVAVRVTTDPWL